MGMNAYALHQKIPQTIGIQTWFLLYHKHVTMQYIKINFYAPTHKLFLWSKRRHIHFFVDIELGRVSTKAKNSAKCKNHTNNIQNSTLLEILLLEKNKCEWRRLKVAYNFIYLCIRVDAIKSPLACQHAYTCSFKRYWKINFVNLIKILIHFSTIRNHLIIFYFHNRLSIRLDWIFF